MVIYLKEESVNLAVQLLDESAFDGKATGPFIRVERANFKDYKCNLIKEENLSESKIVPNVSDLTHCSRPDLSAPSLSSESAEEKLLKKRKIEKLKQ